MTPDLRERFREFLAKYPLKTHAKGEIIIFQGEAPRSAYVVESGTVKAYNLSVSGDEKPVGFYGALDAFPGMWIYDQTPSSIYYYEVFSDEVTLRVVPKNDYLTFIGSHRDIMLFELKRYVSDQLAKSMRLNALQHSRAGDKLIYTLHYLALKHGVRMPDGRQKINLHLTHQDFANLTGLTRETAATELNKLKHSGVIDYGKSTAYQVDIKKLAALQHDEYIADIQIKQ